MEHTHRLIIVCEHLLDRANRFPDVLWLESGEVQAAVCFHCAHDVNAAKEDNEEPPAAMRPLCTSCAGIAGIPVAAKMPDGFYEYHERQWVKQPQKEDAVN